MEKTALREMDGYSADIPSQPSAAMGRATRASRYPSISSSPPNEQDPELHPIKPEHLIDPLYWLVMCKEERK